MSEHQDRISLRDLEAARARVTEAEVELRARVAQAVREGELPVTRIARAAGINRLTAYAWTEADSAGNSP